MLGLQAPLLDCLRWSESRGLCPVWQSSFLEALFFLQELLDGMLFNFLMNFSLHFLYLAINILCRKKTSIGVPTISPLLPPKTPPTKTPPTKTPSGPASPLKSPPVIETSPPPPVLASPPPPALPVFDNTCTDTPPDSRFTCSQQAGCGKCGETWMQVRKSKKCFIWEKGYYR